MMCERGTNAVSVPFGDDRSGLLLLGVGLTLRLLGVQLLEPSLDGRRSGLPLKAPAALLEVVGGWVELRQLAVRPTDPATPLAIAEHEHDGWVLAAPRIAGDPLQVVFLRGAGGFDCGEHCTWFDSAAHHPMLVTAKPPRGPSAAPLPRRDPDLKGWSWAIVDDSVGREGRNGGIAAVAELGDDDVDAGCQSPRHISAPEDER